MSAAEAEQLRAALSSYDRGDLEHAKPILLEFARRYPANLQAETAAGMTLAESGDVQGSLPFLQRAHALAPRDADISVNLAVAYLKLEAPLKAVSLLQDAAQTAPGSAPVHLLLAQAELRAGRTAEATNAFQQTSALLHAQGVEPQADLLHDWAVALLQSGRPKEAATLLSARPDVANNASLLSVLAEAEEKSGAFQLAVAHYKSAAELDGSEANLFAYGNELLQHWSFQPAIEIFRFGVEHYPASDRMEMALGIAYYGNNQYGAAVPVFKAELERRPDSAVAADLLGRSCSAISGAQQSGCDALRTFAQTHPQNAPASLYAAIAILHQPLDQQDTVLADTLLHNALRADAKLPEAWYQLGVLQQSRNEWQASADSLVQAVALRADFPEAHYRLARAYSRLGKRDQAEQQIALQQRYAVETKEAENKRMQEVMTFLTTPN
ncbi:tetratricopeptide repeat protein [Terriglobus sp.]|uniref:tetratricopeptide repeat protein n=1 Tax=Terriglobus sp. TaxID=1889013 RepID=UPI003B00CBD9